MDAISNGVRIRYDDLGRGEPALLLMTGWCDNRTVFSQLAPKCAAHRRTLVVDWPAHGESETPRSDFGEKELIEAAQAVIAKTHTWFSVRRLNGETHFPPLELPDTVAAPIEQFIT